MKIGSTTSSTSRTRRFQRFLPTFLSAALQMNSSYVFLPWSGWWASSTLGTYVPSTKIAQPIPVPSVRIISVPLPAMTP